MDNDFLTQSGLPELSLSGVRTCGLNSISCAFPHRKLTVVAGPPGAGKTALVVYTAYAEARRRLALGLGEDRVWPLRYYPAAEFDAVNGLLPAVNISDLAGEAQGSGPVLSLLGLDGMLSSVLYHYGNLHCARDGAVIEDASAAQVFCQVSEFAKTESASGKDAARGGTLNLLAEAVIYEAAGVNPEAPTLETLVQQVVTFQKRGYRRFVINASLYTLPPFGDPALRGEAAQAVDEARKNFIDAISSAGSISYFAVVVDSIVFRVQEKERFLDAVYAAQAAGEGIAVLRPALRTSAAQSAAALDLSPICWRSFAGCCCPECGQRFSQSVSVLQREVRAGVLARRPGKKRHVELRLFKKNLAEILAEPLSSLHELVESGQRGRGDASDTPAAACAARLTAALSSLCRLGLDHLALSLPAKTLSSGERLRVQTARFLLAQVAETLFVLDEPSRVLHQADLHLLSAALRELVDRGNTVV
ncbi:MAG TPA: hypothetical protein PLP17_00460, partial [Oligoflexia bacterium]|nr:hypothetical protein [Oligoflexia bacterium]